MRSLGFHFFILTLSTLTWASDFPIKMPKTSSSFLFSEAVNNQIGFSVNQKDKALADLFDRTKTPAESELCGPTTVANLMAYFKFSNPKENNVVLKYEPTDPSYINQVGEYFNLCHTDSKNGTLIVNIADCISQVFKQSQFANSKVSVVGPSLVNLSPDYRGATKAVDVNDIRDAFKNNYGVMLELKWYQYDETVTPHAWVSNSGHYVLVVGYDYDESFGDSKIILKIVNPEVDYSGRDPYQRFDSIEMMKIPKKAGMTYPAGTNYILDGFNFKGVAKRGFVRYLILSKPHVEPIAPLK